MDGDLPATPATTDRSPWSWVPRATLGVLVLVAAGFLVLVLLAMA